MPEPRVSLEDIIRSAAADLPPHKRTIVLTELLVDLDSARGLELLSQARSAISLRMQELIDERVGELLPEPELPRVHFKPDDALVALRRKNRIEQTKQALNRMCDHIVARFSGGVAAINDEEAEEIALLLRGDFREGR